MRVPVCVPISLLSNGSVNMLPLQQIHVTTKELMDASFFMRPVSYERREEILLSKYNSDEFITTTVNITL